MEFVHTYGNGRELSSPDDDSAMAFTTITDSRLFLIGSQHSCRAEKDARPSVPHLSRRYAKEFAKTACHVALISETAAIGDIRQWQGRV